MEELLVRMFAVAAAVELIAASWTHARSSTLTDAMSAHALLPRCLQPVVGATLPALEVVLAIALLGVPFLPTASVVVGGVVAALVGLAFFTYLATVVAQRRGLASGCGCTALSHDVSARSLLPAAVLAIAGGVVAIGAAAADASVPAGVGAFAYVAGASVGGLAMTLPNALAGPADGVIA